MRLRRGMGALAGLLIVAGLARVACAPRPMNIRVYSSTKLFRRLWCAVK